MSHEWHHFLFCAVCERPMSHLQFCHATLSCNFIRDVPDIWFRFRLAGYLAIFCYPVLEPAKILSSTGSCSWIIYLFNGAKKRYFRKSISILYNYNNSFWHWYHQFHYIPLVFLHLQQQPNETIQQNRSTWQLLKSTCTNYSYYYAWIATFVLSDSGSSRIVKFTIRYIPKLYHATKSQVWHGMSHNSWTVAQLLIRI